MAMTENDKIQKYGPVVQHVNSRSEPDKVYHIRLKNNVHFCDCKGWIFSKEVPKSCKHIKAYLAQAGVETQEAGERETAIAERVIKDANLWSTLQSALGAAFHQKLRDLGKAIAPHLGAGGALVGTSGGLFDDGPIRMITLDE